MSLKNTKKYKAYLFEAVLVKGDNEFEYMLLCPMNKSKYNMALKKDLRKKN